MTELKLCWEYLASAARGRRCKCHAPPACGSASGNLTGRTPVVRARAASCGWLRLLLSAFLLLFGGGSMRGERFGDISVTVSGMHQGRTFHGYLEYRVTVENHSPKHTHRVRLVYPERSWSYGNSIDRLTRTVVVPPGTQLVVPLWQPPLEIHGNQNLQVEVDGRVAGRVSVPVAGQHAPERRGYPSDPPPSAVLVSRGLDMAAVERVLIPERIELGAAAATGPPDVGRFKAPHLIWTPDPFAPGPHWIELDYTPPVTADTLRIYHGWTAITATGTVALIGVSGSNILTLPFGGPDSADLLQQHGGTGRVRELRFERTREPVRTVRIEFREICSIDAVGLSGPGGTA